MPRWLISTDLDGTIVFNGTIPLRDREAMARWRAAGNLLVINTGRSVSALEHVVGAHGPGVRQRHPLHGGRHRG